MLLITSRGGKGWVFPKVKHLQRLMRLQIQSVIVAVATVLPCISEAWPSYCVFSITWLHHVCCRSLYSVYYTQSATWMYTVLLLCMLQAEGGSAAWQPCGAWCKIIHLGNNRHVMLVPWLCWPHFHMSLMFLSSVKSNTGLGYRRLTQNVEPNSCS